MLVDGQPLVQAYADALSSAVEAHPAQYFWWHRRFAKIFVKPLLSVVHAL